MKKVLPNLLVALLSITVSLALGEIIARKIYKEKRTESQQPRTHWVQVPERIWTEYHPALGWYHQPNKYVMLTTDHFKSGVRINSAGFRGIREYDQKKPAGVTRILTFGDSFVFGFGVEEEQVFTKVLEEKHSKLELPNVGIPGFGLDQMLVAYREIGKKYETDYVLIGIFEEDFWRNLRAFADSGHAKPYFILQKDGKLSLKNNPVPQPFELNKNQFPEVIEYSTFESLLRHSFLYRQLKKSFGRLGINLGLLDPDRSEEWILGRAILQQFLQEIRAAGAKPLLMVLPPKNWVESDRKTSLQKSLNKFSQRESVDLIDLTPIFREAIKSSTITTYYIEGDWHWTAKGHALAAQTLERYLKDKLVIQ
jgi:hypothetical protein